MNTAALDSRLATLLTYWEEKRGERHMPARADIEPTEIGKDLLPYLALTEAVDGGARFRFRLCGTGLESFAGLNLTGRFIDELNPNAAYATYIIGLYRTTMESKRPTYSESEHANAQSRTRRITMRLICPLSEDDQCVNMFLAGQLSRVDGDGIAPTLTFSTSFKPGEFRVL